MLQLLKRINWWRVASYTALIASAVGYWIALLLDGDALQWLTPTLVALVWARWEWFMSEVNGAKSDDEEDDI